MEIPILETFYNVSHFLWEEEGGSIISAKLEGGQGESRGGIHKPQKSLKGLTFRSTLFLVFSYTIKHGYDFSHTKEVQKKTMTPQS